MAPPVLALTNALWISAQSTHIMSVAEPAERTERHLAPFAGLLSFPAPFVGGVLYEYAGFAAPLIANFLGTVVVLSVVALRVKDVRRREPGEPVPGAKATSS